jgi:hypothetical protein
VRAECSREQRADDLRTEDADGFGTVFGRELRALIQTQIHSFSLTPRE